MNMHYKTFSSLSQVKNCIHGFTYRNGGVAELPFGNQHMGLLSFHHQDKAWENIKNLVSSLGEGIKPEALVVTEQIHEDKIVNFSLNENKGELRDGYAVHVLKGTDGVFTKDKNVLLMTFYADCTPVYFYDKHLDAIGMVHSGWKGTKLQIANKGLSFMITEFGSNIEDVQVVIGPAASKCCYEVDQVVFNNFPNYAHCFEWVYENHYLMDMKRIIAEDLMSQGLKETQIEISTDCTLCQTELYFSHRREAGNTGRMAAFMMRY